MSGRVRVAPKTCPGGVWGASGGLGAQTVAQKTPLVEEQNSQSHPPVEGQKNKKPNILFTRWESPCGKPPHGGSPMGAMSTRTLLKNTENRSESTTAFKYLNFPEPWYSFSATPHSTNVYPLTKKPTMSPFLSGAHDPSKICCPTGRGSLLLLFCYGDQIRSLMFIWIYSLCFVMLLIVLFVVCYLY